MHANKENSTGKITTRKYKGDQSYTIPCSENEDRFISFVSFIICVLIMIRNDFYLLIFDAIAQRSFPNHIQTVSFEFFFS